MKSKSMLLPILLPLFLFYAISAEAVEQKEQTLEEEVMYTIVVDRFFDGNSENNRDVDVNNPNAFNGGDFAGITKKLEYLKEMGMTTIILSPIFVNEKDGYHGYWIYDFYNTDPHFGTLTEFQKLVKEAHNRDMKVMIDLDLKHVGHNHPWLTDVDKKDWFTEKKEVTDEIKRGELETAWIEELPNLNIENPEVKEYLLEVARWWIAKTDLDGYRLVSPQDMGTDFLKEFVEVVKKEKTDFYVIGDSFGSEIESMSSYEAIGIDAFMDYKQNENLRQAFAAPDGSLMNLLTIQEKNPSTKLVTFLDTSLSTRFTLHAVNANQHPGTRWKLALTYLYTSSGAPNVLYGSEIALNGRKLPENQSFMNFKTDQELVEYITKLADIRAAHPALSNGKMEILFAKDGVAVYKRNVADETMVVVINNTSKTQKIVLNQSQLEGNKELRGELNDDLVRSQDNLYTIVVDREQAEIYTLKSKSMINMPYFIALISVLAAFAVFIILIIKRSKRNSVD